MIPCLRRESTKGRRVTVPGSVSPDTGDKSRQEGLMISWFRTRRRKKLAGAPFPSSWEDILRRNMAHFAMLDDGERDRLRALIQVFIAEKYWEAAGGLEMTDEIRVTISGQACLLLMGLPHNYYENVESIIVYPSTVVPPKRKPGSFENTFAPVELAQPILGQAFSRGPVILVWDAALRGGGTQRPVTT